MQAALEQSGEDQISLTDPDSRAMAAHTRVAVGYNAQIAVDAKHKLTPNRSTIQDVGERSTGGVGSDKKSA